MIKSTLLRSLLGLLLLAFAAENAMAQRPAATEARAERERLKRLIETAHEVLTAYPNAQAQQLLLKAETLTKEIDQKLAAGNFALALAQTREAIGLVEKVIKLALESPLLRLRNRLLELAQRAETEVLGSGNREAIRLAQEARKNQLLGEQAAMRMQPLQAAQHFQAAITLLERALKLTGRNPGSDLNPAEAVQRAREYYLDLLKQLEERLPECGNPAARRLMDQIKKQMQFAEDALRQGDYVRAQSFYNNAVRLLLRALDLCAAREVAQNAEALKAELAALREQLAAAEESRKGGAASNEPRLRALLDWARRLLLEAEDDIAANRLQSAQRRLQRARLLIERVLNHKAEARVDHQAQCDAALEQLAADIEELSDELAAANNAEAKNLLELARKVRLEAEKICGRKPHTLQSLAAFRALLRLAHQFLLQAETLLQEAPQGGAQDQEALRQRLQQLDATLAEVRSNAGGEQKGLAKVLIDQAVDLRDRSQAAFQKRQFYLSAEYCNLSFDLLREALKLGKEE